MSERDTGSLDRLGHDKSETKSESAPTATGVAPGAKPQEVQRPSGPRLPVVPHVVEWVEVNYPDPTPLSQVIRDVAKWSQKAFVMEPSLNAKIQIFAPRKMAPSDAYDLFLASLSVVGLRAVQSGPVIKIVQISVSVSA